MSDKTKIEWTDSTGCAVTRQWPYLLVGGVLVLILASVLACLWGLAIAGEVGR